MKWFSLSFSSSPLLLSSVLTQRYWVTVSDNGNHSKGIHTHSHSVSHTHREHEWSKEPHPSLWIWGVKREKCPCRNRFLWAPPPLVTASNRRLYIEAGHSDPQTSPLSGFTSSVTAHGLSLIVFSGTSGVSYKWHHHSSQTERVLQFK